MAHNASPSTELMCLPNENLSTILAYAMVTTEPVDLPSCIHKGRNHWEKPPRDAGLYEKWLDQLDDSQKRHQVDWIMVNSTSRRFRNVGKEAFFTNKIFALGCREIGQMEKGNLVGLGTLNTGIAVSRITAVQALVPGKGISVLPRFTLFPRLRTLQFQQFGVHISIFECQAGNQSRRKAGLMNILKDLKCSIQRVAYAECTVQFRLEGSADANHKLSELVRLIFGSYC